MPLPHNWRESRAAVDDQLTRIEIKTDRIEENVTAIKVDVANLKGRAATWGVIGGAIVSAIVSTAFHVLKVH